MPNLTIPFDTGNVSIARIANAYAEVYGYSATVPDPVKLNEFIPNPMTKAQFIRHVIRQHIIATVREADLRAVKASAEAAVINIDLT